MRVSIHSNSPPPLILAPPPKYKICAMRRFMHQLSEKVLIIITTMQFHLLPTRSRLICYTANPHRRPVALPSSTLPSGHALQHHPGHYLTMDTPMAGGPQHLREPKPEEQQYLEGSASDRGEAEPHQEIISYRTFITGNSTSSENDYIEQERSNGKSSDGSSPQETGSVGSERLAQPPEIHPSSEGSAINQEVEVEVEASEIGSKRKHNAETGSEAPAQPQQPSKRTRAYVPSSSSSASTSSDTSVPAQESVQKRKRAPKTPKTLKKNIGGVFRQQTDPRYQD
ncbi:hypothetical protein CPB84DRAFT_243800 [Gymnopilus junonius]|uniref:Uncharacterized protein n=1 Tax=Gymnopilus junonius TaxID=109634 RepID=A0A9P5NVM2_GYMJU|nr:hypothetical protein CPB84DRAFT_243800 [Gymnopilus junonius]